MVIEPDQVDLDHYRRIGEERTRTLEFEPGRLYVKETVRPQYGLKDNLSLPKEGESGVIITPLPPSPVYKCLAGSTMMAEMLLQKYEYHVPFYRQVKVFRHLGVHLSESTLSSWFKPVCELLKPLYLLRAGPAGCRLRVCPSGRDHCKSNQQGKGEGRQGISVDGQGGHGKAGHFP